MVFATIDGANFRLTGPVGARVAKVPDVTLLGVRVPGEEMEDGSVLTRSVMAQIGLPHTIVVNRTGKRFGNEAFYREFFAKTDVIDGATQTHANFPSWAIIDSQAREKYIFGAVPPGQDFPEGMAVKSDTIGGLAGAIGCNQAELEATVARFNLHAENSEDPDWGRGTHPWSAYMSGDPLHKPHPNLGALRKAPFYAIELCRMGGSAIPSTGVVADHHCRAMDWLGKPIPGLYVAGNSVARLETGAMMQSGVSNARGMTHGWLAALHAVGKPSELLATEARRIGL